MIGPGCTSSQISPGLSLKQTLGPAPCAFIMAAGPREDAHEHGGRGDLSTPFVDACCRPALAARRDPGLTRRHRLVNIRKFVVSAGALDELVGLGPLRVHAVRFLEAGVVAGLNIIVAGDTQAGKPASCEYAPNAGVVSLP